LIYSDLREIKKVLEINECDNREDGKLLFFAEWVTRWVEEILDRDFSFKTRTEYYNGTNTQWINLRKRPVYPNPPNPLYSPISVIYDPLGYYGSAPGSFNPSVSATAVQLTYGTDFCLQIDRDDGGSNSGVLIRINEYWIKPILRQNPFLSSYRAEDTGSYQVVYSAGYFVDNLPAPLRMACNALVAKLRYFFPVGMELGSDSYEERAIGIVTENKGYILTPAIKSMILQYRNWKW
jgi:hypothetical protein